MIVIIEDNIDFSNIFSKRLRMEWFNTTIFNSIKSYAHIEADLYIIDLHLEKKSYWLIKKIRNQTDKPIMVLSAYNNVEYINKTIDYWADCYIIKWISIIELISQIKALLRFYNRLTE